MTLLTIVKKNLSSFLELFFSNAKNADFLGRTFSVGTRNTFMYSLSLYLLLYLGNKFKSENSNTNNESKLEAIVNVQTNRVNVQTFFVSNISNTFLNYFQWHVQR